MLFRSFIRFVLLVTLFIMAACGNAAAPTAVPLTQPFDSSDGTITFQYPAGWIISDAAGQISIANAQAAVNALAPAPGQFQARMFAAPITAINGMSADSTPRQVIDSFAASLSTEGVTFNSTTELRIGDRADVARLEGAGTDGQAVVLVVALGEGNFLFVTATTAPGELTRFEPTLHSIIGSLTYTPLVVTSEAAP